MSPGNLRLWVLAPSAKNLALAPPRPLRAWLPHDGWAWRGPTRQPSPGGRAAPSPASSPHSRLLQEHSGQARIPALLAEAWC